MQPQELFYAGGQYLRQIWRRNTWSFVSVVCLWDPACLPIFYTLQQCLSSRGSRSPVGSRNVLLGIV